MLPTSKDLQDPDAKECVRNSVAVARWEKEDFLYTSERDDYLCITIISRVAALIANIALQNSRSDDEEHNLKTVTADLLRTYNQHRADLFPEANVCIVYFPSSRSTGPRSDKAAHTKIGKVKKLLERQNFDCSHEFVPKTCHGEERKVIIDGRKAFLQDLYAGGEFIMTVDHGTTFVKIAPRGELNGSSGHSSRAGTDVNRSDSRNRRSRERDDRGSREGGVKHVDPRDKHRGGDYSDDDDNDGDDYVGGSYNHHDLVDSNDDTDDDNGGHVHGHGSVDGRGHGHDQVHPGHRESKRGDRPNDHPPVSSRQHGRHGQERGRGRENDDKRDQARHGSRHGVPEPSRRTHHSHHPSTSHRHHSE